MSRAQNAGRPAPGGDATEARLGLPTATAVVVGGIIGVGIFFTPARVAATAGSTAGLFLAFGTGAVIALLGALAYADLSARIPKAGGVYVFLREALGPLPAFLYGWILLVAILPGAIALIALIFARNVGAALFGGVPPGGAAETVLATALIVAMTLINVRGLRPGARAQNLLTWLKTGLALVLSIGGLLLAPAPAGAGAGAAPLSAMTLLAALPPVLFSFGGWQHGASIAGLVRRPSVTIPLATLLGVGIVVAVYLGLCLFYVRALGFHGVATAAELAAEATSRAVGPFGGRIVAALIGLSAAGIVSTLFFAPPWIFLAMAQDGCFFRRAALVDPRRGTPRFTIVLLGLGSLICLFAFGGRVERLLDFVVFDDWMFFLAAGLSAVILRKRRTGEPLPFRIPLTPLPAVLFSLSAAGILVSMLADPDKRRDALAGLVLLFAGLPAALIFRRGQRTREKGLSRPR